MNKKIQVIRSIRAMQKLADDYRCRRKMIGIVPTMGALHDGHLTLIRRSVKQCDVTVVTVFVNPTQFAPNEDFSKYPRSFKSDCGKAFETGADIVFHPDVKSIYPDSFETYVLPNGIANRLEGAARPGHMKGVATICLKLFHIVKPHKAFFGQKDAQQLAMIRRMVADLNLDLKVIRCPIVRSKRGVALSSRHSYLSADDLIKAEVIYDSLKLARKLIGEGVHQANRIELEMRGLIKTVPGAKAEYISFTRWDSLEELDRLDGRVLISLVVRISGIRLLDNIIAKV